jgi:hypothetical protein
LFPISFILSFRLVSLLFTFLDHFFLYSLSCMLRLTISAYNSVVNEFIMKLDKLIIYLDVHYTLIFYFYNIFANKIVI